MQQVKSRRAQAQAQATPRAEHTLAPGCEWHVTEGVGKSGITATVARKGDADVVTRKLTYVPQIGRVHAVPEHAVFDALDAGDMDDVIAPEGDEGDERVLSAWIREAPDEGEGMFEDARGQLYVLATPDVLDALSAPDESDEDAPAE